MFRVLVICSWFITLINLNGLSQTTGIPSSLGNFRITKVSVNSNLNEYAPVFQNGKLLFISDNRDRFGVYFSSTDSMSQLSSVYIAKAYTDSTFSKPELIDNRLNRCYNSGPAWIDSLGEHLFFSSNETSHFFLFTSKRKSKLRIFESNLEKGKWSKRRKLAFCNGAFNYTHPYLNPRKDTLYFASDRPGGFGGFDLYYSVHQNGTWSEPINMGATINSDRNDLFPFYNGIQFVFSSDRAFGMGKLDLYSYRIAENEVIHLGLPFNSEADDFTYTAVDKEKGYFASNRDGNDEIYLYQELFPSFQDCETYMKDPFCFTFFEETDELDEELDLEYVWNFGDGAGAKGKEARHCFAGYGEYLVELNIVDRTTSEVFYNQTSYPFAIEHSKRLHIEGADTIPTSFPVTFTGENSQLEGYEIKRFFWELDGGQLRVSDTNRFTFTCEKEGVHQITLGVIARANDGTGEKQFCVTKSFVVVKGIKPVIAANLPSVKSWETSKPVSDYQYTLFLGVSDTLVNMGSINNKDSLRIQPVGDSLYLYSMGISNQKNTFLEEYRMAQEMGFSSSQVTETKDGMLIQTDKLAHTNLVEVGNILDNRIKKEQVITSFEIFYDFDVFELTKRNRQQIQELAFDHKSTANRKILISSFTDVKGKNEYNLKLSKKRSLAVQDELVKNGFPIEQIELEYYGKRVPQNMEPLSDAKRRKSLIIVYEKK
jgi:outer membrane protein OmpA-like peptidoglycan-associated protein